MYLTTKQQQFEIQLLNTQKRSVQCRYSAEISREIAVASQCKFIIKIMTPPVDPSILRWHTNTNKKCSRCEFWRGLCILFGKKDWNSYRNSFWNYYQNSYQNSHQNSYWNSYWNSYQNFYQNSHRILIGMIIGILIGMIIEIIFGILIINTKQLVS